MRLTLGNRPGQGQTLEQAADTAPAAVPPPARALRLTLGGAGGPAEASAPEADVPAPTKAGTRFALGEPDDIAAAGLAPVVDAVSPASARSLDLAPPAGQEMPAAAPPPTPAPKPAPTPQPAPPAPLPPLGAAPPRAPAPAPAAPRPVTRGLPPLPDLGAPPPPQARPASPVARPSGVSALPPLGEVPPPPPVARPAPPAVEPPPAPKPSASPEPARPPGPELKLVEPPPPLPPPAADPAPPAAPATGGAGGKPPVRLGDKLVERGLISKDQLMVALQEKKRSPKMMGELLVDLGFITEQALAAVLAEDSGFERFDPAGTMVDPELLKMIPKEVANRYRVFPVTMQEKTVRLAMADIYDVMALDQVKRHLPADVEIQPLVCSDTEIQQAIDQYYGHELSIDGVLRELERLRDGDVDAAALDDATGGYTHPVVRLVNAILLDAVKSKASDIHFEPEGNFLRVRYRIDGMMMQIRTIHKQHWGAFSHRMKIMSGMNIADRLNPQDGRFSLAMANKRIDFRVSSLPTVHGENLVLRILDKSSAQVELTDLGYSAHNFEMLTRMVRRPEGIIIVTGPTGSGKTTTLYAIMNYINSLDLNIMTLEDPVEFELSLIRQSQIREGSQMTFADGIRSLMRQDPDVILVGEVRDADTASMALRAAMTGHQVYTTLHTNDAAGAIPRLQDLGMRPSLMSGNIIGVVAQRLGRKLCDACKQPTPATERECRILGVDRAAPPVIHHPKGCEKCRGTGYKGRIAVSEILPFNDTIDEMIIADAPLSRIRERAREFGFIPMVEDGIGKVLAGVMSIEGLMKAVNITDRL